MRPHALRGTASTKCSGSAAEPHTALTAYDGGTRLKQYDYQEEPQVIDVQSYERVPDSAVFTQQKQSAAAQAMRTQEVMQDPERCFCRNCGQPVLKAASVCVNCHFVLNPQALRLGAQRIRARRAKYEKSHRIFQFINNVTGVDLESEASKSLFEVAPQKYVYRTTGAVYCTNCGTQVDEGASVCVRCKYVLNPAAVRRAQLALLDKQAKLTPALILKSLLIPGFGRIQSRQWAVRRPQIAKPCSLLGKINTALLIGGAALYILLH